MNCCTLKVPARNHYLFHYCISGTGTLISTDSKGESHTYQIKSGEGFLIYPKQINTYFADKNHPWEYTWVEFDGLRVKEALELAGLTMDAPAISFQCQGPKPGTRKMKCSILPGTSDQSPFHPIGHLYLFLDYLTRSLPPAGY